MTYRKAQATPSGNITQLERYVFRELERISNAFQVLNTETNPVPTLNAEPAKLKEGLLVIADGVDWNPGSGNGLYIYLNGAWSFIV